MSDSVGKVRVYVRCRPLQSKEIVDQKNQKCVSFNRTNKKKVIVGNGKEFTFDQIYDDDSTQEEIFVDCVKPLVEGCFQGYNATVLAYGQTGSGKTHTMGSSVELLSTEDEGVIPRAVRHMFSILSSNDEKRVVNLRVSFLEIYNEEMRDLLHPEVPSRDIALREDNMGRIFFTGAREEIVAKAEDVFKCLESGAMNRTTAGTLMNDASSRSHAIFTISIDIYESKMVGDGSNKTEQSPSSGDSKMSDSQQKEVNSYVHSKIHLVDLAGSERAKRTGAVGVRLKESVGINQGLMSLGKVIRTLTSNISAANKGGTVNAQHVPYRDSKLTRFLQDSLGGNSRTVMIACISPAESSLHETLTTLQYASRTRAVTNKVKANVSVAQVAVDDGLVDALKQQLAQMQEQLRVREMADLQIAEGGGDGKSIPVIADIISQQKREIILDRLRGVEHVLQNAVKFFDSGLDNGWLQMDVSYADSWENTVCNIHNCSSILEDVGSLVRESSGRNVETRAEEIEGSTSTAAAAAKKIQSLQIELAECREDLKRDEEIFGEKVLELKQTRRVAKKLQEENASLREAMKQLQQSGGSASEPSEEKDMDISMAVVASEPHLSQLMEDLEAISKEKEALNAEKENAEKKFALATSVAEKQKEDFDKHQNKMQRRLKDLEFGIKMKQEVISSLTKEQQEAVHKADLYAERIKELEQHTEKLLVKSISIPQQSSTSDETALKQQREYESKIERAQAEIAKMKKEWKKEQIAFRDNLDLSSSLISDPGSPSAAESSRDLIEDLHSMKVEHARLQSLLAASESKQKQKLESLSKQVDTYKKKAVDSEKEIRNLEARNAELQSNFSQKTGVTLLPPPPMSVENTCDKDGYLRRHSGPGSAKTASKKKSKNKGGNILDRDEDSSMWQDAYEWIQSQVNRLFAAKAARQESSSLKQASEALTADKAKLEEERDELVSKQEHGENVLQKQCKEVDSRIARIVKEISSKKKEIRRLREEGNERREEEGSLVAEVSEAERKLRSYQEHKAELIQRTDKGVLSNNDQIRLQEIKDDLEALDAEIQLNNLHLTTVHKTTSLVTSEEDEDDSEDGSLISDEGALVARMEGNLIQELTRKLEGENGEANLVGGKSSATGRQISPSVKGIMTYMAREIIGEKMKNQSSSQEAKRIHLQLEDKNAEFEQLALVLHRTRGDLTRKLEKQQKEYEDKIAFLIQQLRGAEMKIHESSNLLRKSFDGNTTSDGGEGSLLGSSQHRNAGSLYLRPRTSHAAHGRTQMSMRTSSSDGVNDGNVRDGGRKEDTNSAADNDEVADAVRKWESERQRRELLEKRNSELMRELRIYRGRERK